jgi:N-acetylmuramoyl-L-alanine amidase/Putative peptidoglycan binding domain
MTAIALSSGHGLKIRGAADILDEVNEARRIVEEVCRILKASAVRFIKFHDDVSTTQNENLNRIVNWHNAQSRDLDVSVHLNAYQHTSKPMGTECLYVTQQSLATTVAGAMAKAGQFINRGPKKRTDLFFLNSTNKPAILLEVCFVDSQADAYLYEQHFGGICLAIAEAITGLVLTAPPPEQPQPQPPDAELPAGHPTIAVGDAGAAVSELQEKLGVLDDDGDFGQITDTWVRTFQKTCDLSADGIVGPKTWAEVDDLSRRRRFARPPLPRELAEDIVDLAKGSPIYAYAWPDRGLPYPGFIPGMALCFAYALRLDNDASEVMSMAAGDPYTDALAWYAQEFAALEMSNKVAGADTLRHLFVMMIGLGPRESSGKYCEGRDMSASNVQSDTAEAGLFQTSWNISNAHPSIFAMLDQYWQNPRGFLDTFKEEVYPTASNLDSYGSGAGIRYQFLSRFCPLFHVMVTAVGMRTLRQHWGPINRREVDLREDADDMLRAVQNIAQRGLVA